MSKSKSRFISYIKKANIFLYPLLTAYLIFIFLILNGNNAVLFYFIASLAVVPLLSIYPSMLKLFPRFCIYVEKLALDA